MSATKSTPHLPYAPIAFGGGVLWLVSALAAGVLGDPGEQSQIAGSLAYYLVGALSSFAFFAPLAGFAALHIHHGQRLGRLGTPAVYLAVSGTLLMFMANLANTAAGRWIAALTPPFLLGFILAAAGSILLGILLLRARELPLWCGVVLILLFPLIGVVGPLLGSVAVGMIQGVAWIALAMQLLRASRSALPSPV